MGKTASITKPPWPTPSAWRTRGRRPLVMRWRCLSPAEQQEATARSANRRLPVNFKALIRRLTIGGHARQQ